MFRRLFSRILIMLVVAWLAFVVLGSLRFWEGSGNDFTAWAMAGRAVNLGLDPYIHWQQSDPGFDLGLPPQKPIANNLNPPISLYVFRYIDDVGYETVLAGWRWVSFGLYCVLVAAFLWRYPERRKPLVVLAVFAIAGFWQTVGNGQIYIPLVIAASGAYMLIERDKRPWLAGACVGLVVAIKPMFVIWPLLLFARGERRESTGALLVASAISLLPLLDYGPAIYESWLNVVMNLDAPGRDANSSLPAALARFGLFGLDMPAAVMLVSACLLLASRAQTSPTETSALAIVTTILASPIAWSMYMLFLLPIFMTRPWRSPEWAALILLSVPVAIVAHAGEQTFGLIYFVALVTLTGALCWPLIQRVLPHRERAPVPSRVLAEA